ncbi:Sulfofructose kinase [Anaerolineales bacterium]|nr:Sulfofructose kinase [Anaerolineales bacterium]
MSKKQIDVIGLGASTIDLLTLVEHFPTRREAQQALSTVIQGGGPVATAMVAASRLGCKSAMIDSIGDDWAGRLVLRDFQNEGVETDVIEVHHGKNTAVSNILVSAADGARAIMFLPGTAPEPVLSEVQKAVIQSAKILHITGRYWNACMQAVELAKRSGIQVSFDGGADRFKPEMKALVPLTDICIVARDFAEKYTGESEPLRSAISLLKEGPTIVAVTDGVNGSWVCTRESCFHQPAFLFPKVVDTTGCGDGYHGAFLAARVKGFPVEKSAIVASAVAGINTQHLGGRVGIPVFAEVMKFLVERGVALG